MSNETKSDQKQPAKPDPVLGESIPVAVLRFTGVTSGAGLNVASSVTYRPEHRERGQRHWLLDFFPRVRHHRVTCVRPGEPAEVAFVPESRVESWDPAIDRHLDKDPA